MDPASVLIPDEAPTKTDDFAHHNGMTPPGAFYAGLMDDVWVGDVKVLAQPGGLYGSWVAPNVDGGIRGKPGTGHW